MRRSIFIVIAVVALVPCLGFSSYLSLAHPIQPPRAEPSTTPQYGIQAVGPAGSAYVPVLINSARQLIGHDQQGNQFYLSGGKLYFPPLPQGASCWTFTGLNDTGDVAGYALVGQGCTLPAKPFEAHITGGSFAVRWLLGPFNSDGDREMDSARGFRRSAEFAGCFAFSINKRRQVSGVCDNSGRVAESTWSFNPQSGYSSPQLLAWPKNVEGPTGGSATAALPTRSIDGRGDILGEGRCSTKPSTSVAVFWPVAHRPLVLSQRTGRQACAHAVGGVSMTTALSTVSNVTGSPKNLHGGALITGSCYVSGNAKSPRYEPCAWRVRFEGQRVTVAAPLYLDTSHATRWGSASDVNSRKWIVGDRGNVADTADLWLPVHSTYKPYALGWLLSASVGWNLPACGEFGPSALNSHGDVAGVGILKGQTTGFLMTRLAEPSKQPSSVGGSSIPRANASSRDGALPSCGK